MQSDPIVVDEIAHHRNGVGGSSFYVVLFRDGRLNLVASVFEERGSVCVFDRDLLGAGVIEFGFNSFRGDVYEDELRAACAACEGRRCV